MLPACAGPAPAQPALQTRLDSIIRPYAADSCWLVGVAVHSLTQDSLLFASMETVPLVPASNVKLLTTASAIENWSDSLVKSIENRLSRSRRKEHRFLLDTAKLDTLGIEFPESPRGARYVVWTSHVSDNRLANWLMTELCRSESLLPDEFAHRYLEQHGIPVPGLNIIDGSGRSPLNRMAVVTIIGLLRHMYGSRHRDLFLSTLPSPGATGSLKERGLGLGHRVRAKTGFIKGSFALSGYMAAQTDTFAFSFLVNNCISGRSAYRLFTRLLLALYHWNASTESREARSKEMQQ